MIKILAIGNSFSVDCTEYLSKMFEDAKTAVKIGNLYIGGCSLERHARGIENSSHDYEYFINARSYGRGYDLLSVLLSDDWDFVTLQQCSDHSGVCESYRPHIDKIISLVKKHRPRAKIIINETWAYEINSKHPAFATYGGSQDKMYNCLKECYTKISSELSLPMIAVGELVQKLRKMPDFDFANGGISLCRDGYHLDLTYGRFAAACLWFAFFSRQSTNSFSFAPPISDSQMSEKRHNELINLIKMTADEYLCTFS